VPLTLPRGMAWLGSLVLATVCYGPLGFAGPRTLCAGYTKSYQHSSFGRVLF